MSDGHSHDTPRNVLLLGLLITLGFAAVEAVAGWLANSLALLGDAGHMLTDSAALGIGALAAWIARFPATRRHSYGLQRAEVMGAMLNVLIMYGVVAVICIHAIERLQAPVEVDPLTVIVVGSLGLLVNIGVALLLHRGAHSLNVRGALLHVLGDLLGSVAAVAAGMVIWLTGWMPIDPLLSLLICGLILVSSTRLLLETLHVLMEGVPPDIEPEEVSDALCQLDARILGVHHVHIWDISSESRAMSAHVRMRDLETWPALLPAMTRMLHERFNIDHPTLQPETGPECADIARN